MSDSMYILEESKSTMFDFFAFLNAVQKIDNYKDIGIKHEFQYDDKISGVETKIEKVSVGTKDELVGYDVTDVLKYYFEDGSFVAVRPSGTEPKCKVYFSIKDVTYEAAKVKNDNYHKYMAELLK